MLQKEPIDNHHLAGQDLGILISSASSLALSLIFMRNIPGTYKQFLCNCIQIQKSQQRNLAANDGKSIAVQQLLHVHKL